MYYNSIETGFNLAPLYCTTPFALLVIWINIFVINYYKAVILFSQTNTKPKTQFSYRHFATPTPISSEESLFH